MLFIKSFLSLLILSSSYLADYQKTMVKVRVSCTNFAGKPLPGEQIWFKDLRSNKIYKDITLESGQFLIELEGPGEYMIMIKSVGQANDYSKLIFPTLKAGQSYGIYEVTVKIDPGKEFTLDHVFFEFGKSTLKKESFSELDELVEMLQFKKNMIIEIGGHTDDRGADADNLTLSKNRAESVKKYLVQHGISANRVITKGYGESQPIADNSTEAGRSKNRRTEVRIVKE